MLLTNKSRAFANMVTIYVIIGFLVVVLGLGYAFLQGDTNKQTAQLPLQVSGVKSINEIRDIASTGLGEGISIVSVELEEEDAGLIYKVKLSDGTVLFFNAESGDKVVDPSDDDEQKDDEGEQDEIPDGFVAKISLAQARTIAESKVAGGIVKKIELEMENGVAVYSVRFTNSARVDINAETGAVIKIEKGDDSGQDQEDDEDSDSNDDFDIGEDS